MQIEHGLMLVDFRDGGARIGSEICLLVSVTQLFVKRKLYNLKEFCEALGSISVWTLRKHVAAGSVSVVRIGRRIFLTETELQRICKEGLPRLGST